MKSQGGISYHEYKSKVKCGRCHKYKHKIVKIKYTNYPQQVSKGKPRKVHRVMTMCSDCRDDMVRIMTIEKLMGRG